jgi:hypothetical protein
LANSRVSSSDNTRVISNEERGRFSHHSRTLGWKISFTSGGKSWWAWRTAWRVFLARVARETILRRPTTRERTSLTSLGGTQTAGSR